MARLSSTARVSITGRDAIDAREAAIEQKCWLVWARAHSLLSEAGGRPQSLDGADGIAGELALRGVVARLWPELSGKERRAEMDAFIAPIYEYLKKSGNARCVLQPAPGSGKRPVWWIRNTWREVLAVHIGMAARSEESYLTRREKQLSPAEAGEDRQPAEIEIRFMEPAGSPSEPEKATEAVDKLRPYLEQRSREHVDLVGMVQLVLEDTTQPLTAGEVQQYLERELNYTYEITTVRNTLKELLDAGRIAMRKETTDERQIRAAGAALGAHAMLYWAPVGDVPARTEREAVSGVLLEIDWASRQSHAGPAISSGPAITVTGTVTDLAASLNEMIEREVEARSAALRKQLAAVSAELEAARAELATLEQIRRLTSGG